METTAEQLFNGQQIDRNKPQPDWPLRIAIVVSFLGLLFNILGVLWGLHSGTTLYWWMIFASNTALPFAVILILIFSILFPITLIECLWENFRRGYCYTTLKFRALALTFMAGIFMCTASLWVTQFGLNVIHQDSLHFNKSTYYLSARSSISDGVFFTLYECDRIGVLCHEVNVSRPSLRGAEHNVILVGDASEKTISVQIDGEIVYTYPLTKP